MNKVSTPPASPSKLRTSNKENEANRIGNWKNREVRFEEMLRENNFKKIGKATTSTSETTILVRLEAIKNANIETHLLVRQEVVKELLGELVFPDNTNPKQLLDKLFKLIDQLDEEDPVLFEIKMQTLVRCVILIAMLWITLGSTLSTPWFIPTMTICSTLVIFSQL